MTKFNPDVYEGEKGVTRDLDVLRDEDIALFQRFIQSALMLFNGDQIAYINNKAGRLLGYSKEEILGKKFSNIKKHVGEDDFNLYINKVLENGSQFINYSMPILGKNKARLWVEILGKTVMYRSEKYILASLEDISQVKRATASLARLAKLRNLMLEISRLSLRMRDIDILLELILENALKSIDNGTVGSILRRQNNHFVVASQIGFNESFKNFRLPVEEAFLYSATGGRMDRIVNIKDVREFRNYYAVKISGGKNQYIKSSISAPIYVENRLFGLINIDCVETNAFDEDDIKSMEFIRNYVEIVLTNYLLYKEKVYLASYDHLTHCYNRGAFEEKAEILIEKAVKYQETFCLVLYDINNLKAINDSLGHLAGDRIISEFADRLKYNARSTDFIGRIGGDEFVGVYFNADLEDVNKKVMRLLEDMERESFNIGGKTINCTFSYGIAQFPEDGKKLKQLIRIADNRMYDFKEAYKTGS